VRLTKSQKRVIKQMNRYLSYGERQTSKSAEPERHGREDVPPAGSDGRMTVDDVKSLQQRVSSSRTGSAYVSAGPADSESVTASSGRHEKIALHKPPKPGKSL